jgi:LEA14-like dessication related protein
MPSQSARFATILLLFFSAAGCATITSLEAPEIQLTSLQLLAPEPGSLEQRFAVGLRVINPNNRSMAVDGMDFELDLNDKRLARGVTNRAFELPRLGETETTVVVTTSVLDLLRQAVDYAGRPDAPLNYRLRGRVHLGSGFVRSVPFDHRGLLMP